MKLRAALLLLTAWLDGAIGKVWDITGPCLPDPEYPDCVITPNHTSTWWYPEECALQIVDQSGNRVLLASHSIGEGFFLLDGSPVHADPGTNTLANSSTSIHWVPSRPLLTSGWRLCALKIDGPWLITGNCERDASDTDCITSAYYPNNYDSEDRCWMRMFEPQSRILEVTEFKTNPDDLLVIASKASAQNFSGDSAVDLDGLSVDNKTSLNWTVLSDETSTGWRICARKERPWSLSGDCTIDADDTRCVVSPDVGGNYSANRSCSLRLVDGKTRQFELTHFDMPFKGDKFSVLNSDGDEESWTDYVGGEFPIDLNWLIVDNTTRLRWSSGMDSPGGSWRLCAGDIRSSWITSGHWSFVGDCEIDPLDSECIQSPGMERFPENGPNSASHYKYLPGGESCAMHVVGGERLLNVTHFNIDLDTFLRFGNFSLNNYEPGLVHGAHVNASIPIHWQAPRNRWWSRNEYWRICARAPGTWNMSTVINRAWNVTGNCRIDPEDDECILNPIRDRVTGALPTIDHCDMRPMGSQRRMVILDHYHVNGAIPAHLQFKNGPWLRGFPYGFDLKPGVAVDNTSLLTWHTSGEIFRSISLDEGWRICSRETDDGVWDVLGNCQVAADDPECVTAMSHYGSDNECEVRFKANETRRLQVVSFAVYAAWIRVFNFTDLSYRMNDYDYDDPLLALQGLEIDRSIMMSWRTPSWATGWRICARTPDRWFLPDLHTSTTTSTANTQTTLSPWEKEQLEQEMLKERVQIAGISSVGGLALLMAVAAVAYKKGFCPCKPTDAAARSLTKCTDKTGTHMQCRSCSAAFTVTYSAGALKVTCPTCMAVNEFSIAAEVAATVPPEADLPEYWTSERAAGIFCGLVTESDDIKQAMQVMLDRTWKNMVTRDRSRADRLSKFEVIMVHRNENVLKWDRYARTRAEIASRCIGCRQQTAKTSSKIIDDPAGLAFFNRSQLQEACNECYLFHGTNPSAAKAICDNSFQLSMAGTNAGTLYGPGIYFAEASSKADEYAEEDREGIFAGLYAMLVCRVVCGNMRYTDEVRPDRDSLVNSIVKHRTKHSILGDREKCKNTYREFVVFDRDQVFPEYAVVYRRVPFHRQE